MIVVTTPQTAPTRLYTDDLKTEQANPSRNLLPLRDRLRVVTPDLQKKVGVSHTRQAGQTQASADAALHFITIKRTSFDLLAPVTSQHGCAQLQLAAYFPNQFFKRIRA